LDLLNSHRYSTPEKINKGMDIYELTEGRKSCIRDIAMSVIERHNRGNPSPSSFRWIQKLTSNLKFMKELRREAERYKCTDTSLVDDDGWLDTAGIFAQALNILEEYRNNLELDSIQARRRMLRW
jgi:hypothetical protein